MCQTIYVSRYGDQWIAWGSDQPGMAVMDRYASRAVMRMVDLCNGMERARHEADPSRPHLASEHTVELRERPPVSLFRPKDV